ncbi:Ig-like domain-containing protein [Chryseobacterium sp. 2TAF14]|uniref:Ig-like domain-containing protein n=1 Tax=Chryseobacterium sp. 2TAF14 TaxID=3233007 RepID=UPI003F915690
MNAKLNNITTQYRKFNPSQVLTESQLNEFIDYFEDQDRLSRTRLSGVGIVCGFKSTYIESATDASLIDTLEITQGSGVTTDGDLVTLRQKGSIASEATINFEAKNYKYYREYTDPVGYDHFRILEQPETFLELITQQEYQALGANNVGFKLLKDIRSTLHDKVVILYLESYSNEENPCQDADCDNAGAEQVSNLKVLLADSGSVLNLIKNGDAKDSIYTAHNDYEKLFNGLPKIEAKRVILDPAVDTTFELKTRFQNATDTSVQLNNGFGAIAKAFNVNVNLGGQTLLNKLNSLFQNTSPRLEDYQYRYDLQKDLIDTYNEIKDLILHLDFECCPQVASFPKHLMLGYVGAKLELGDENLYRHDFYHSPITTTDDENYEKIVMLANRFVQKINAFQAYIGPIKITPSRLNVRLGDKAIPYYYNVDKQLLGKWNFEKTKTDREAYNLSYHTANLATDDFVQNPLNYNIDDNDFYRIEGHLGLPFETAYQNITDLKKQYGLAFDVIVLLLNKDEKADSVAKLTEIKTLSIEELRKQVVLISSDISREKTDSKSALLTLSKLDSQLKLLNKVDFVRAADPSKEEITIVKEDPRKEEITSELLSEFLERKSGLEHLGGVEKGGAFVLICGSGTNNQVLADFSLPYLCCSKEKPNVPPIAMDDKASCMLGKSVVIPVLSNDYDADNDILTVVKKTNPSYGTVVLNTDNTFTYTHDGSSNLSDSFTYCVNDGKDDSNIATVFINVKSAPVAINDHASTGSGGEVFISVKDNDYDLGNTPLTVFIKTQPTYGTATLMADGKIKYSHNGTSTALTDSFTYYINDGEFDSNIATVTISIAPPPCNSGMDVVFIFDYTGSMGGQIEAAKSGAESIITTIKAESGSNAYRLGIVLADENNSGTVSRYHTAPAYTSLPSSRKYINDGVGSSFQWITAMEVMSADNNENSFKLQLDKLNNPGGGLSLGSGVGGPEPTDMALSRVVEHNFAGTFRNNVAKYVIIITDITPGGNDDNATSADVDELNRLKAECVRKSIKVIVLGSGVNSQIGGKYIWRDLADGTGGSWNSSYNASAIQSAIINGCGGER